MDIGAHCNYLEGKWTGTYTFYSQIVTRRMHNDLHEVEFNMHVSQILGLSESAVSACSCSK